MTATATSTEVLTATRSHTHRAVTWTPCGRDSRCPCTGSLSIATKKGVEKYGVIEIGVGTGFPPGLGYQCVKPNGEVYSCLLADRRELSTCDCAGYTYASSRKADARHKTTSDTLGCKHLDAILSLIQNGWLADPRCNPDQDVSNTETD